MRTFLPQYRQIILGVGGGANFAIFNVADVSANIALSGGNLTAIQTSAPVAFNAARATVGKTFGKFYYEATWATLAGNPWMGIMGHGDSLSGFVGGGSTGAGWSVTSSASNVRANNSIIATVTGNVLTAGDTGCVAVDLSGKLLWIRKSSVATWNNSSTADPAAGTGGISFSVVGAGPYYPAVSIQTQNDSVTMNFGASPFLGAIPANFRSWRS